MCPSTHTRLRASLQRAPFFKNIKKTPLSPLTPSGLVKIAGELDHKLLAPRKKISVVLIGNHSAGKSSFINWYERGQCGGVCVSHCASHTCRYVEEHVQKTGVAIETQGFTLVTSGKKRETLKGPATLHLFPYFSAIGQLAGTNALHADQYN